MSEPLNCKAHAQEDWASWPLAIFLHSLAYLVSVGLLRTNF